MSETETLVPVLPLRDVVVYPHMVIPLFVGREKSIDALNAAMQENKKILLVAQREADVDEPGFEDLYEVGTLANILQLLKLPDGTAKVLVEGIERNRGGSISGDRGVILPRRLPGLTTFWLFPSKTGCAQTHGDELIRPICQIQHKIPPEVLNVLNGIDDPSRLADTMAAHIAIKIHEKQVILETADIEQRLEVLMALMEGEVDILEMEKKIRVRVKQQMKKTSASII